MKIVVDGYPALFPGGIGIYVKKLIEGFEREGIPHKVIVFYPPKALNRRAKDPYVDYLIKRMLKIPLPLRFLIEFARHFAFPRLEYFVRDGDIFHGTSGYSLPTSKKLVITVHDLTFVRFPQFVPFDVLSFYTKAVRYSAEMADRIIVPSRATRDDLTQIWGIPGEKITVIPLASSLEDVEIDKKEADRVLSRYNLKPRKYFIFVGTIEKRKNVLKMLKAFRIFREKNTGFVMVMVGDKSFSPLYAKKVFGYIESELEGSVLYLGYLSPKDLAAIMGNARALMLLSHYEGFGLPVIEAMKLGVPSIVSGKGSLSEICANCCIYADEMSPEDIADKMEKLLKEEIYENYRQAALGRGNSFRWERTVKLTINVYKEILS